MSLLQLPSSWPPELSFLFDRTDPSVDFAMVQYLPLPPGWRLLPGPDDTVYYVEQLTNAAYADHPVVLRAEVLAEEAGLPAGWQRHLDEEGHPFFYHASTDVPSWDHPLLKHFIVRELIAASLLPDPSKRAQSIPGNMQRKSICPGARPSVSQPGREPLMRPPSPLPSPSPHHSRSRSPSPAPRAAPTPVPAPAPAPTTALAPRAATTASAPALEPAVANMSDNNELIKHLQSLLLDRIPKVRSTLGLSDVVDQDLTSVLGRAPRTRRGLPVFTLPPLFSGCDVRLLLVEGATSAADVVAAVEGHPAVRSDADVEHPCRLDTHLAISVLSAAKLETASGPVLRATVAFVRLWRSPAHAAVNSILTRYGLTHDMRLGSATDAFDRACAADPSLAPKGRKNSRGDHRRAVSHLLRELIVKCFGSSKTHPRTSPTSPTVSRPPAPPAGAPHAHPHPSAYLDPVSPARTAACVTVQALNDPLTRGPDLFPPVCPTLPPLDWSPDLHHALGSEVLPPQSLPATDVSPNVPLPLDVLPLSPAHQPIAGAELFFARDVTIGDLFLTVLRLSIWRAAARAALSETRAKYSTVDVVAAVRFGDVSSTHPTEPYVRVGIQSVGQGARSSAEQVAKVRLPVFGIVDAGGVDCLLYGQKPPAPAPPPEAESVAAVAEAEAAEVASEMSLSDTENHTEYSSYESYDRDYSDYSDYNDQTPMLPAAPIDPLVAKCFELATAGAKPERAILLDLIRSAHDTLADLGLPQSLPPSADPLLVPSSVELNLRNRQLLSLRAEAAHAVLDVQAVAQAIVAAAQAGATTVGHATPPPLTDVFAWMGGAYRCQGLTMGVQPAVAQSSTSQNSSSGPVHGAVIVRRRSTSTAPATPAPATPAAAAPTPEPVSERLNQVLGQTLGLCIMRPDIVASAVSTDDLSDLGASHGVTSRLTGGSAALAAAFTLVHSVFGPTLPRTVRLATLSILVQTTVTATVTSTASATAWPAHATFPSALLHALASDPAVTAWAASIVSAPIRVTAPSTTTLGGTGTSGGAGGAGRALPADAFGAVSVIDLVRNNATALAEAGAARGGVGATEKVLFGCVARMLRGASHSQPPELLTVVLASLQAGLRALNLDPTTTATTYQTAAAVLLAHVLNHAVAHSDAPGVVRRAAPGAPLTSTMRAAASSVYATCLSVFLPLWSPLAPLPRGSWLDSAAAVGALRFRATALFDKFGAATEDLVPQETVQMAEPPAPAPGPGAVGAGLLAVAPPPGTASLVTLRAALAQTSLLYTFTPVHPADATLLATLLTRALSSARRAEMARAGVNAAGLRLAETRLAGAAEVLELHARTTGDSWVGLGCPLGEEGEALLRLVDAPLTPAPDDTALAVNAAVRDLYSAIRSRDARGVAQAQATLIANRAYISNSTATMHTLDGAVADAVAAGRSAARAACWFLPRPQWPAAAVAEARRCTDEAVAVETPSPAPVSLPLPPALSPPLPLPRRRGQEAVAPAEEQMEEQEELLSPGLDFSIHTGRPTEAPLPVPLNTDGFSTLMSTYRKQFGH